MANASTREQDVFGKQLNKRKKGRFWKGFGLFSIVVLGAGAGVFGFTQPGRDAARTISDFGPAIISAQQNPNLLFDSVGQNHVNILVVGQDRNWKQGEVLDPSTGKMRPYQVIDNDTRARADTMIVCSLDKDTGTMRMISIPRDTRVRYRDFEGLRHPSRRREWVKLNSVYSEPEGDKLLVKVMADELGIRIDRVAKVKLDGFTKLIDRVGGININVEGALFSGKRKRMQYEDKWGGWKVDLEPGMQLLNGEQAHGYVRFRMDNEGDPGRVRRQQQVMRALAKKMMNVGPFELPGMVTELQNLFLSSMSNEEMVSAAKFARGLGDPSKITPLTPYGIYAGSDIILNKPENIKLFKTIFGASFDPTHFLVMSPETTRDDIGARNNDNPAALAILNEAGLMKTENLAHHNAQIEAPGLQ
ncbi:transcriptional attenuator, LytR family [Abditibacterium utsteinense]|uniref:Transcriptional attenuator, LytR family n=1 Tax=Abditibacterium utsteinense TaxID=1960156 RepID=A0A2S8SPY1_9BACT|nr:LCP family protein [Abditibacterium utsteinense]PQV62836.1 transcriptional attenuator, LytR family [Abditibacterium utsteinense]